MGIKLIKKNNENAEKAVLTIEGGRAKGITYEMAKALGPTNVSVYMENSGPFGEDEGAVAVSFRPEDAKGKMDLGDGDFAPADATDIIVFDKDLGQTGCNWSDYELVEPDIYVRTEDLAAAVTAWHGAGLI